MGVIKNDVGRPSNKTIMVRRIFKAVLCILLFVVCYFVGYKFGSSIDKKEEVVKITDDEVRELYNKFNSFNTGLDLLPLDDSSNYISEYLYTYFYQNKLTNKDVIDEIKFAIAYNEVYWKPAGDDPIEKIYLSELNKKSEELFGSKIDVDNILFDGVGINKDKKMLKIAIHGGSWSYNENDKSFNNEDGGVGDCSSAHYTSKIVSIERKVGKVEIISKPIFVYISGCEGDVYKIFKAANKDAKYYNLDDEVVDLTSKVNFASTEEEQQSLMQSQLETYSDKLDSYKWTFVQTEKGNFIFDSVEKITK